MVYLLAGNRLTTLPESFGDLSSLVWLDVKDNPLSTGIKKEAGDCLDDKQCRTCAIRVSRWINNGDSFCRISCCHSLHDYS